MSRTVNNYKSKSRPVKVPKTEGTYTANNSVSQTRDKIKNDKQKKSN
jgi:hypothetical protein